MTQQWLSLMSLNGRRKLSPAGTNPGPCTPVQNPLVTHLLHHTAKNPRGKELKPRLTPLLGHPWLQVPAWRLSQRLLKMCSLTALLLVCPHHQSYPLLDELPLLLLPAVCSIPGTKLLAWDFCLCNNPVSVKRQSHDSLVPRASCCS